jgi:CrcB protein
VFPFGTFAVNAVGCVAFGIIIGLADHRATLTPEARAFLLIGLLGGFTTFSTYAFESVQLLRDGELALAAFNIAGQVVAGVAGLWAGAAIGGRV